MRLAFVVGLGLLGACVPSDHPPWLVDHPMPWGIVASVVEPGGYSTGLVVPEGRVRASALPLDTLELQWIAATPPGVTVPPPIWFICPSYCGALLAEPLPTCPFPLPLAITENCRLGEGERVRLSLGGAYTADETFLGHFGVLAITGDGSIDAETCVQRLGTIPRSGLERCLVQTRLIELGPLGRLLTTVPGLVDDDAIAELPDDLADEPADFHPVLAGVRVRHFGRGGLQEQLAQPGDTIEVRVDDIVHLVPEFTVDSEQDYYEITLSSGTPQRLSAILKREWFLTRTGITTLVDTLDPPDADNISTWRVPDEPEPILFYFYSTDIRQGRAFASLRFVVADATPAP